MMVKWSDLVICDSVTIEKYIHESYDGKGIDGRNPQTTFIAYYDPDFSVNYYLAAPSKFFEYISVGLNVVSSKNHGIDRIIEEYDLGVCFTNEEGVKEGIEKLLAKGLNSRENIKKVFEEHFCYEVDSKETIDAISELIDES